MPRNFIPLDYGRINAGGAQGAVANVFFFPSTALISNQPVPSSKESGKEKSENHVVIIMLK